ncbi:MAG: hypothetical protein R3E83_13685 [Burkholderiaceae bacterium]
MRVVDWCPWCDSRPLTKRDGSAGRGATNVWGVKDIDEAKAHLDAHCVKQDGDIQHVPGMVKLITFFDLDGNAMMFAQTLTTQD